MAHSFVIDTYEPDWLKTPLIEAGWNEVSLESYKPGADGAWLNKRGQTVGFQRKTITDMLTSWWEGRLQEQLANLCSSVDIPFLFLEGTPGITKESTKTFKYVNGKSQPVTMPRGTLTAEGKPVTRAFKNHLDPVKYETFSKIVGELTGQRPDGCKFDLVMCPGWQEYVVYMLSKRLPEVYDSEEYSGWVRLQKGENHDDPNVQALLGIKGMGAKRAKDLLEHFGSPWEVIQAARQGRLLEKKKAVVAGVGPNLVKKIQEVWGIEV